MIENATGENQRIQFHTRFQKTGRKLFRVEGMVTCRERNEEEWLLLIQPCNGEDLEKTVDGKVVWKNRGSLIRKMEVLLKQETEFTLVQFRIDHFSYLSDVFGSQGERILSTVIANRISEYFAEEQQLYQTTRGMFALILPTHPECDIENKINELLIYINRPVTIHQSEVRVTVRVGMVKGTNDQTHPFTLLNHAQTALELGERKHKYLHFFKEEEKKEHKYQLQIERELIAAVGKKQFTVHYQPILDVMAKEVKGLEALLRWDHPQLGMIPPDQFIPYLEETGLIVQVGYDTLRTVCRHLKQWKQEGFTNMNMHLNISVRQISVQWVQQVKKIMKEEQVEASDFTFEITESSIMEDSDYFISLIDNVRELGCNVSIDDFGTGFSALSYLTSLNVDSLKIDKCFLEGLNNGAKARAVVKSIISLAHHLNLKVIAEGVEEEKHIDFLISQHCYDMQGFYFSKPMPPVEVTNYLRQPLKIHT